ncbi:gamma-mobile-trio recombinase GmtY [Variovorax ureilyticus]|uniref:Gamma-mobile-trio recombinase GmtY n=1 Tax=Variovorax ureilyticus TaxID=1836198 RepID=A0ABU8VTA8_9BURK
MGPISIVSANIRHQYGQPPIAMPVLWTENGPLRAPIEYFIAFEKKSLAWKRKVLRSLVLLLEYAEANPGEADGVRLFRGFASTALRGTFEPQNGIDTSGLCWLPNPSFGDDVSRLTGFFNWAVDNSYVAKNINPLVGEPLRRDQKLIKAAYDHRREKAFLGHNWIENPAPEDSLIRGREVYLGESRQTRSPLFPRFPDHRFDELICSGFFANGKFDLRDILITLLLHCGGLRVSEPFHLYWTDVVPDPLNPKSALVLIHHPEDGDAPKDSSGITYKNRRDYLAKKWGLLPRNIDQGYRHAGWKGGRHESEVAKKYYQVYWAAPQYGELFLLIWNRYVEESVGLIRKHPFAFVNDDREPLGEMYAISQYIKRHKAAVRRIGLVVKKELGTTSHGHRHAYSNRLKEAGIDRLVRMVCLHHMNQSSQDAYLRKTSSETVKILTEAFTRLLAKSGKASSVDSRLFELLS